jgi:predicted glycosyltransferase
MRIWVDVTNSPHAVIFRPLVARLRARGHEVTITSRDYAQTLGLLDCFEMPHLVVGAHGGGSLAGKARAMAGRTRALSLFARRERFDLAVAHGSTDQPVAARLSGTPQVTMFDYEFATAMHHLNGRLATRVLVPDAISAAALARYGMRRKLVRYPGLKEEYYLADHVPDPAVADELGLEPGRLIAVLRPPPEVTLYHRGLSSDVFSQTLERLLAATAEVQTVVLPRTGEQRRALRGRPAIVPGRPVDGPTLVGLADLVVSAGGTMNREAAALGVPAYTPFAGKLGAVDRALITQGRLRRLERASDVELVPRARGEAPPLRDPETLLDLILGAARTGDNGGVSL